MRVPLTLEDSLILACARTDPDVHRIQELAERGPDWEAILRKVERWGLAPLAYTSLQLASRSGRVPGPVTEAVNPPSPFGSIVSVRPADGTGAFVPVVTIVRG